MITGCANKDISPRSKESNHNRRGIFAAVMIMLLAAAPAIGQVVISGKSSALDFGEVGMDFKVFTTFHLVNKSSNPVRVKSINVPCSCSSVAISDSTLKPGDSSAVRLMFDTKNMYGKTIRSFTIFTSDPATPKLEYSYYSVVGQWLFGIRPNPTSLFFLPTMKTKTLSFPNEAVDHMTLKVLDQADTTYTIKVLNDKAVKGGRADLEISPKEGLKPGTYLSSFRVEVSLSGQRDPFLISVPVKIVRY